MFFAFLRATFELGRSDFLDLLAPYFERYGPVGNFVGVIHRLHQRGQIGLSEVFSALNETAPSERESKRHCEALLQNFVIPVPGGGGNYARLRIYVWNHHLRPLRQALIDRDVSYLRGAIIELRDSHTVCEKARIEVGKSRHTTIKDTHVDNTLEFVRDARSAIMLAVDELEGSSDSGKVNRQKIAAAWSSIQEGSSGEVTTAEGLQACVRRWLAALLNDGLAEDDHISQDFQDWRQEDFLQQFWRLELPPWARRCWRMRWRGVRARAEDALYDLLGRWGGGGLTPREHVEHFHTTGNLSAARAACRYWGMEVLGPCAEQVDQAFLKRRAALEARVKRLHTSAKSREGGSSDEFKAEIEEIEAVLSEHHLELAEEDLEVVEQLFEESQRESEEDGRLRPLRDYLRRGNVEVSDKCELEELSRQREEFRKVNEDRMVHLRALRGFDRAVIPTELRKSSRLLIERLDDPAFWPNAANSGQTAEAVSGAILVLQPLFHMREQLSSQAQADVDAITAGLGAWLMACGPDDLARIEDVFLEVATLDQPTSVEVRGVLADAGICLPPEAPEQKDDTDSDDPGTVVAPGPGIARFQESVFPSAPLGGVPLRRRPPKRLQDAHVPSELEVDHQTLMNALHAQDFGVVRQQSAGLWRKVSDPLYRDELAAYFCVADLLSPPKPLASAKEVAFRAREAASWLAQSWSRSRVNLPEMLVEVLAIGLRASGAETTEGSGDVADYLEVDWEANRGALLDLLEDGAAGAPWLVWVSKHTAGHKAIARALFELFKQSRLRFNPQQHNNVRYQLLELLHKGGAWSVLEALLLEVGRKKQEFTDVVRALEEAASGRDVSGALLALAGHLSRGARVPGWSDPLLRLIQSALATRPEGVSPIKDLRFEGQLEVIGPGMVEGTLLIVPSDDSSPRKVTLEIPEGLGIEFQGGGRRQSVHDGSAMFRPFRVDMRFSVAHAFVNSGGVDELRLRVTGTTLTGQDFSEVRTLRACIGSEATFKPFLESDIRPHYPAAKGSAAEPAHFLGRESTLAHLENCLIKDDSPGTLTIFGPRRVGKTSLLLRFLSDYAYGRGRVNDLAVLYFDLEGWHLPEDPTQLYASFYRSFLTGLKHPRNRALFTKLETRVSSESLQALGRRNDQADSFSEMLEGYLGGLLDLAKGHVGRVILIFDEGDKLVQPFLARSDTYHRHINAVLGQFRSISQHLAGVGIVLAGTDLMRRLMSDYHQSFFSSTQVLTIGGLDWEAELDAIVRLVFPPAVKQRLQVEDDTLRYIFDLTGGIPYYLACVGYAIAALTRRAHVTISTVNRAVEGIMTDQVPGTLQLNPGIFLKPLETLASLGSPREQIALLVLYKLSGEIELDFPTASPAHIVDDEELLERLGGKERDLWALIRVLGDCQFIDVLPGQLRFKVPIFGHALRSQRAIRIPTLLEQTEPS